METRAITAAELGIPGQITLPRRKDWRIGMVGFGGIADAHVQAYRKAGWQIVAVADPSPDAQKRAGTLGDSCRIYGSYEELVADPQVEVVALLTQPTLREPVVRAAAAQGKHILTEKPFGRNLEECWNMVRLASAAGVKLAVSQNYRYLPANFYAHHIIDAGLIGTPFFVSIDIYGTQDVGLATHPFYSKCDDFITLQWNNHLADLMRYMVGRNPQRVLATTRRMEGQNFVSDNLLISMTDFGPGVTGHIVHHELLRSSLSQCRCRVDGSEGSMVFDVWGAELHLSSRRVGKETYHLEQTGEGLLPSMCGTMGDLLISIEENREPLISGRQNLMTIGHVLCEDRSARAGGVWVDVTGADRGQEIAGTPCSSGAGKEHVAATAS